MLTGLPKSRPDERLRIVFFTASYFVLDGVTLTIRKILQACKEAGHETMVITAAPISDTLGELGELDGENLVLVPGMPVPMESSGDGGHYGYALGLGLSSDARARLAEFKPHVAHFTVCDLLGMDGVGWAKQNQVALVGTWHSNYCDYIKFYSAAWWLTPVLRRYIQQFYGAIPTTFVPTVFMRSKLTAEGYHEYTDMQVWGRGIDLERFNPCRRSEAFRRSCSASSHHQEDASSSSSGGCASSASHSNGSANGAGSGGSGGGGGDVLIIWVGRLVPEKRPDIWRDVFQRLCDEGLPVKGVVVGVGPSKPMFDLLPGVTVKGWLSGADLAEAYASADLLLFPSDVETFGNVTLEALGSGIPAVVEEQCSSHLVSDGAEGFTVHQGIDDPNDKAQYEACVQRYLEKTRLLVTDAKLRARCGKSALVKAATYSNAAVQGRMIDNYRTAYATQVEEGQGLAAQARVTRFGNPHGGSGTGSGGGGSGPNSSFDGGNGCGGGGSGSGGCGGSGHGCGGDGSAELEDPNDKSTAKLGRRSKRQLCSAACARLLCCWWSRWCFLCCAASSSSSYITSGGRSGLRADLAHFVWSWLARIVIFVLWLLLGLPHVTSTNLAETNIRQAAHGGGASIV